MAGQHERPERAGVAGSERGRELEHTRVLGDDVPGTRVVAHLLQAWRRAAWRTPRRAAAASHAARRSAYALSASVRGSPECDDDARRCARGIGDRVDVERAAVEQERVPGRREQRGELVHEPAGHAGRRDFGRERERGEVGAIERVSPARSANATVSATVNAELDDKPDPAGTVDAIVEVDGAGARRAERRELRARRRRRSDPSAVRPSPGPWCRRRATTTSPASCSERARIAGGRRRA